MIDKREIIDTASALGLNPHVVEKDYVLGWMLWGISNHDALATSWVFKGGTCLKKCFFETYRFSEDLDFTLTDGSHLHIDFLKEVFTQIGESIYEETGIELPSDYQKFDIYTNPRGEKSCQCKIGYQGPVSPRGSFCHPFNHRSFIRTRTPLREASEFYPMPMKRHSGRKSGRSRNDHVRATSTMS